MRHRAGLRKAFPDHWSFLLGEIALYRATGGRRPRRRRGRRRQYLQPEPGYPGPMNAIAYAIPDQAAASNPAGLIAVLIGGLLIAGALVWAVRLGIKVRRREPGPPGPHEQPSMPSTGPVRETREVREENEVPQAGDRTERLTPHGLQPSGSKRSETQKRRRWNPGSSGGFGSGGPGRT